MLILVSYNESTKSSFGSFKVKVQQVRNRKAPGGVFKTSNQIQSLTSCPLDPCATKYWGEVSSRCPSAFYNVVYQTARNDLLDLHSLGLLEEARQGNAYVFFAPEDLRERLRALST